MVVSGRETPAFLCNGLTYPPQDGRYVLLFGYPYQCGYVPVGRARDLLPCGEQLLTPALVGLENALDLPNAATLCNQCGVVCPVKIPLPELLRKLRERQFERRLRPWSERAALGLWAWFAQRPALYGCLARLAARMLAWWGGRDRLVRRLPFGAGWTEGRELPAPEGATFRDLYARIRQERAP